MFYRLLLTYFFRCRCLPSVLAAASLPSQSLLCSVLFCKLLLLIAPIFSAIFLCVHHNFLSVSLSLPLSLSSSLTLSFDFRLFPCHFHLDMCVCVSQSVCCTYVDLCVRSISWPFVVPSHFPNQCANCQANEGGAGGSRALYRSIVSTKIGSTNCRRCCCCCCKLHTCGMSAHLSSGSRQISRGKSQPIRDKINFEFAFIDMGFVSRLSGVFTIKDLRSCDLPLYSSPPPFLTATANLGS